MRSLISLLVLIFLSIPCLAENPPQGNPLESLSDEQIQRVGKIYRKDAENGNAEKQFLYGFFLQHETKEFQEAAKWLTKAAEQGHVIAQDKLGDTYRNGEGVPQDDKEAVKLFTLAAEQGYAKAQHNLALKYSSGRGVPQNYVQAHMWFNLSATNGKAEAKELRTHIAKSMTSEQIAEAQKLAREWFKEFERKAARGGDQNK
jgi:TPR repeat protein